MSNNDSDTWKDSDKTWADLRRAKLADVDCECGRTSFGYECEVEGCEALATRHSPTGSNRPVYCELHRWTDDG